MPQRDLSRYGEKENKTTFDKLIDLFQPKTEAQPSKKPPVAAASPVPSVDPYEAEKLKRSMKRPY